MPFSFIALGRGFDSFNGVYVGDVFERDEKEESKAFYKNNLKKETRTKRSLTEKRRVSRKRGKYCFV